ncbi:MAG: M3 family oligoendopeptidase [Terriglobia bacterium]
MTLLTNIPHRYQRRLVLASLDFSNWENLLPFFERLEQRPLNTSEEVEAFLLDRSELLDVIQEEGTLRYIRMTCDTADKDLEKAYFEYLEKIAENIKPADQRLKTKCLQSAGCRQLSNERYFVLWRSFRNEVELFREENVRLETEESKSSQSYQKLMGSLTVEFDGKEQTLQQMSRYQELPDRPLRESAWKAVTERRWKEADKLEALFDGLLELRGKISRNAGFGSYRDYAFRHLERFDYTPEDCFRFHEGVERAVVPLMRKIDAQRARQLKLETLRPWDLQVDPLNRPPLMPFREAAELVEGCLRISGRVDSRFGDFLAAMRDLRLLDLESRKGKAPGGYQSSLEEARLPFIFMNAVGLDGDVRTLLHEAGHAFHVFATQSEPLSDYRHAPIEFCEVASMSMELLGGEFLNIFYSNTEDQHRSKQRHLEGIIDILPWIARVDAFQHWIYTHPGHSVEERRAAWLDLHQRFGGSEDWTGFSQAQATSWHRQLHIFELPFYYIEYAIAQLGALQIWLNAKNDSRQAIESYWSALQLGGSRPLPELFARAGIRFDFGPDVLLPLMSAVEEELDQVSQ